MKRFAFLVLVFSAAVIADEDSGIKQWAEDFETNVETVQMCLDDTQTTEAEMITVEKQLVKVDDDETKINDEAKNLYKKYSSFIACMLEKKEMMKDSKLVVDKIIEAVEKDDDKFSVNKDAVKKCLDMLNDDSEMTRESRAMGATICMVVNEEDKKKKK